MNKNKQKRIEEWRKYFRILKKIGGDSLVWRVWGKKLATNKTK